MCDCPEPSRVCKSCYGNLTPCPGMGPRLAPSLGPLDVEQDQGITVSSD